MILRAAIASVLAVAGSVAPPSVAHDGALDRLVSARLEADGVPGAAIALVRGGRVLVEGFGHGSTDEPVTADTPFRLASLSKAFAAVCVLQLVQSGLVDLDAPLAVVLPELHLADDRAGGVTVRRLLDQTSGLSDVSAPPPPPGVATLEERVAALDGVRLDDDPGARFHYSDVNYALVARVVEVVSGRGYDDYLRSEVLGPLGMAETHSTETAEQARSVAPGLEDGHIQVYGVPVARPELDGFVGGAAGVVSTARDLARWLRFQLGDRPDVLPRHLLALTHRPPPSGTDSDYAMGWARTRVGSVAVLEHTGVLSTSYAFAALAPAGSPSARTGPTGDVGIAFLANTYDGLVDYRGLTDAVVRFATGQQPGPAGGMPSRRVLAFALFAPVLPVLAVGARGVCRSQRWAARRRPLWRTVLEMLALVVPMVLPAALPALVLHAADRRFTSTQLALAVPDVYVLLAASAIAATVVLGSRAAALLHRRGGRC